ncbi:MAG: hypothetical protein ACRDOL_41365, partial [Streptosporangiaceae bacterium]
AQPGARPHQSASIHDTTVPPGTRKDDLSISSCTIRQPPSRPESAVPAPAMKNPVTFCDRR